MRRFSGTSAMPCARIVSGETPAIDFPRNVIVPDDGLRTPVIVQSVVDLPAPL